MTSIAPHIRPVSPRAVQRIRRVFAKHGESHQPIDTYSSTASDAAHIQWRHANTTARIWRGHLPKRNAEKSYGRLRLACNELNDPAFDVRPEVTARIVEVLEREHRAFICGPRRAGKTSHANLAARVLMQKNPGKYAASLYVVWVQEFNINRMTIRKLNEAIQKFFTAQAQQFPEALRQEFLDGLAEAAKSKNAQLISWLDDFLSRHGLRVVIYFAENTRLINNPKTLNFFADQVHCFQNGEIILDWHVYERTERLGRAFPGVEKVFALPVSREVAKRYLTHAVKAHPHIFGGMTEDACDLIVDHFGRHIWHMAYLLNELAGDIFFGDTPAYFPFLKVAGRYWLTKSALQRYFGYWTEATQKADLTYAIDFHDLSPAQQDVVYDLAFYGPVKEDPAHRNVLISLVRLGIIELRADGCYQILGNQRLEFFQSKFSEIYGQ